jgi:hypothetical protein
VGCGLDLTGSGQGPVAGCCECGDEPSGSCATELVILIKECMQLNIILISTKCLHKTPSEPYTVFCFMVQNRSLGISSGMASKPSSLLFVCLERYE